MTARDFNKLLDDKITVDDFKASVGDEVEAYERLIKRKGAAIDLRLNEDEPVRIDRWRIKKLLELVIDGRLTNIHLAYICDCLTLSETVTTDDKTREMIFELADAEINGGYANNETLMDMASKLS